LPSRTASGNQDLPRLSQLLLRPHSEAIGLQGQTEINLAESRHLRGRILEREDGEEEEVEKWEFDKLLDCHNDYGELQYLVKWKHHAATWQPATDLKGQDSILLDFHQANPDKPGLLAWVKGQRA
jgi:hypothetical protein